MSDEVEDLLREVRRSRGEPNPVPAADPAAPLPAPAPAPGGAADGERFDAAALERATRAVEAAAAPRPESAGEVAAPGFLGRLLALREASIVAHREIDLKLGDLGGTALLLGQAPLIAVLVGLAFSGRTENNTIDFVLSMVAVWFGCFNASRELVKERPIFLRERRTGLPVRGYLSAKLGVLLLLGIVQCLVLVGVVASYVTFKGALPLVFLSLFLTTAAASALGLFISAAAPSQTVAMAVVPVALIPQLVFSKPVLGNASEVAERIQQVMLASWGYELLGELRKSAPAWGTVGSDALVLLAAMIGLLLCSGMFLRLQDED